MIRSAREMRKFEVATTDGRVGSIDDFYFDDERWAIRYVVVDTGGWITGRRVLISPLSIDRTDWSGQRLLLSISRSQVMESPGIDTHQPVSRRQERDHLDYYGYPYYWGHAGLWGALAVPMLPTAEELAAQRARAGAAERKAHADGDTHLRSASEVAGYAIRAADGELGHVKDLLFDDQNWATRYLIIDTNNWWFGKHVVVAPEWITGISWPERTVSVKVTRQQIRGAPPYDRAQHLDRQWEVAYHQHLAQPGYWVMEHEARVIPQAPTEVFDNPEPQRDPVPKRSRRRG